MDWNKSSSMREVSSLRQGKKKDLKHLTLHINELKKKKPTNSAQGQQKGGNNKDQSWNK